MKIQEFYAKENEKPLDNILTDGGFCSIFRTVACVGDSLSSGEFESLNDENIKGYHDLFEYSWGQYIARMVGSKVYNFSRGGMTAKEYCENFAESNDFWNVEKRAQCYIIALGCNDVSVNGKNLGTIEDIDVNNWKNNKKTFLGYYAEIIQRYKENQPKAKFFVMTMPFESRKTKERTEAEDLHADLMYKLADLFDNVYVLDFRKYAPEYDEKFHKNFFLGGHLNPAGYVLTAKMTASYIDYIIRNNPEDFSQVGFIGKPWHNSSAKW